MNYYLNLEILKRYKLRYYVSEELLKYGEEEKIFDITLKLLKEIKNLTGLNYDIFLYRYVDEAHIYQMHFVSHSRILNKIHDLTVSNALKSRRGNIYLHNLVALVREDMVVWYHRGWIRDFDYWRMKADEIGREFGLSYPPIHLGLLKMIIESPNYLFNIINIIEKNLSSVGRRLTSHNELMLKVIEKYVDQLSKKKLSILIEVPLGLKLLKNVINKSDNIYGIPISNVLLSAFPLRADIVIIHDPVGISPGIYYCSRGPRQAIKYKNSYMFGLSINVVDIYNLMNSEIGGEVAEIVEIKSGQINEQAIGQLLTYEILLRIDMKVREVRKIIAAPSEYINTVNVLLRIVIDALEINLLPL